MHLPPLTDSPGDQKQVLRRRTPTTKGVCRPVQPLEHVLPLVCAEDGRSVVVVERREQT